MSQRHGDTGDSFHFPVPLHEILLTTVFKGSPRNSSSSLDMGNGAVSVMVKTQLPTPTCQCIA